MKSDMQIRRKNRYEQSDEPPPCCLPKAWDHQPYATDDLRYSTKPDQQIRPRQGRRH